MWEWCCVIITATLYVCFVDQCHPYILLIFMKSFLYYRYLCNKKDHWSPHDCLVIMHSNLLLLTIWVSKRCELCTISTKFISHSKIPQQFAGNLQLLISNDCVGVVLSHTFMPQPYLILLISVTMRALMWHTRKKAIEHHIRGRPTAGTLWQHELTQS